MSEQARQDKPSAKITLESLEDRKGQIVTSLAGTIVMPGKKAALQKELELTSALILSIKESRNFQSDLNESLEALAEGKKQLDTSERQHEATKEQLARSESLREDTESKLAVQVEELEQEKVFRHKSQLENVELKGDLEKVQSLLTESRDEARDVKGLLAQKEEELRLAKDDLVANNELIESKNESFREAVQELDRGNRLLNDSRKELEKVKDDLREANRALEKTDEELALVQTELSTLRLTSQKGEAFMQQFSAVTGIDIDNILENTMDQVQQIAGKVAGVKDIAAAVIGSTSKQAAGDSQIDEFTSFFSKLLKKSGL